jgi:hypothetical protein
MTVRRDGGHRIGALCGLAVVIAISLTAPASASHARPVKKHHPPKAPKEVFAVSLAPNSGLYKFEPRKKKAKVIGSTGTELTDIAFRGKKLFGVSFTALYTIDRSTGAASVVGSLGTSSTNALVTDPKNNQLYGADQQGDFFSIDPSTGQITLIGDFGNGLGSAGDLAFVHHKLYATVYQQQPQSLKSSLAKIDIKSGAATEIGDTGTKNVWGLVDDGDNLYGATKNGRFVSIATKNGKAKTIWKDGIVVSGLAPPP